MRWFIVVLGVCTFASGVRAQARETESEARQLYAEGRAAAENGRWAAAHAAFERGWELSQRPLFLFNMAEASRLGGADARAREEYARYLEHEPEGEVADDARARLEALGGPPPPSTDGEGREDDAEPPAEAPSPDERAASEAPSPEETARAGSPDSPSTVAPAALSPENGNSLLESWIFWGVVGLVVAGGVTAAILLSDDGSERFDPQCGMGCAVLDFSMD